jgi:hypothetical protein
MTDQYLGECPICDRVMVAGRSSDKHHWIPVSYKGKDWSWLHRVCHRKIHSLWTEKELARDWYTADKIRSDPDMAKFILWIAKKPPEFYDGSVTAKRRR